MVSSFTGREGSKPKYMYSMHVMYGQYFQQRTDEPRPGTVANPVRGQLKNGDFFPPVCRRSRLRNWSLETTGSAVSSALAHSFSTLRLKLVLTHGLLSPASHDGVHLCCEPPSGQSRVYQITQLRTYGIYLRHSTAQGLAHKRSPKCVQ